MAVGGDEYDRELSPTPGMGVPTPSGDGVDICG